MKTVAARIALQCERIRNATRSANERTEHNVADARRIIEHLVKNHLPSGSGVDAGCEVIEGKTNLEKLVLSVPFHHMDEHGGYDGWSVYRVTVQETFIGLCAHATGGRKSERDYVRELIEHACGEVVANSEEVAVSVP